MHRKCYECLICYQTVSKGDRQRGRIGGEGERETLSNKFLHSSSLSFFKNKHVCSKHYKK